MDSWLVNIKEICGKNKKRIRGNLMNWIGTFSHSFYCPPFLPNNEFWSEIRNKELLKCPVENVDSRTSGTKPSL